jgi:hypothetical protein
MPTKSNPAVYEQALTKALQELTDVMAERERLDEALDAVDKRIAILRRGAYGLGSLCGKGYYALSAEFPDLFPETSINSDTGLTDAVREVLKADRETYFSAIRVRDSLKDKGYEISKYKNALASIHTVLRRLLSQGEVKEATHEGRAMYRWIKPDDPDEIPF